MRWIVMLHRWIGVGLCLLFTAWFGTGLVMMYVPFPSLPEAERLAHSSRLDLSAIDGGWTQPLSAFEGETIDALRLVAPGRPLLVVETSAGETSAYRLTTGEPLPPLTAADARAAAERFASARAQKVIGPFEFDQWVVHQAFDRYRPYFRVDLDDADGTSLYVSQITGEVLQRTTRFQRGWNYVGAVVHWIYPTVIRKNWALWDRLVWWVSLVGIAGAGLGMTLGVVRLRDAWRRGRRGLASPFIGWLRWHHKLGLLTGVFVVTWIFSGWLSMDHGRLFSVPDPMPEQVDAFRGLGLRQAALRVAPAALAELSGAREIAITALAGLPAVVARYPGRVLTRIYDQGSGPREVVRSDIEAAVQAAWPNVRVVSSERVPDHDVYTDLREGSLGPEILRVRLDDPGATWVHADLQRLQIASVMDRSRRLYRWLFNGLHSLDLPGLVDRRPLWDALMVTLLICGLGFSMTGLVIAYRRITR